MRFVKPYTWEIILTIIIGIVKFAIPLFIPLLIKIVLDDIIAADDLTDVEKTKELFYWLGGTIIVFFIIRPPIEYYRQYFAQHVSNKVLFDIRKEIYAHLQRLSLRYYANTRAGDVISRVINDVEQTKTFVMTGVNECLVRSGDDCNCDCHYVNHGCEANASRIDRISILCLQCEVLFWQIERFDTETFSSTCGCTKLFT